MATIGTLAAKVTADTSQFEKGMKRAGKATQSLGSNVETMKKQMQAIRGYGITAGVFAITRELDRAAVAISKVIELQRQGATFRDIAAEAARAIPVVGELAKSFDKLAEAMSGVAAANEEFKAQATQLDAIDAAMKAANNATLSTQERRRRTQEDYVIAAAPEEQRPFVQLGVERSRALREQAERTAKELAEIDKGAREAEKLGDKNAQKLIKDTRLALANDLAAERLAIEQVFLIRRAQLVQKQLDAEMEAEREFVEKRAAMAEQYNRERMEQIAQAHRLEAEMLEEGYRREDEERASSRSVARLASAMEANSAEAMRFMSASNSNSPESQTAKNTKRTADLINQLKAAWLASQGVVVRI